MAFSWAAESGAFLASPITVAMLQIIRIFISWKRQPFTPEGGWGERNHRVPHQVAEPNFTTCLRSGPGKFLHSRMVILA